jgi:hypothetical protein
LPKPPSDGADDVGKRGAALVAVSDAFGAPKEKLGGALPAPLATDAPNENGLAAGASTGLPNGVASSALGAPKLKGAGVDVPKLEAAWVVVAVGALNAKGPDVAIGVEDTGVPDAGVKENDGGPEAEVVAVALAKEKSGADVAAVVTGAAKDEAGVVPPKAKGALGGVGAAGSAAGAGEAGADPSVAGSSFSSAAMASSVLSAADVAGEKPKLEAAGVADPEAGANENAAGLTTSSGFFSAAPNPVKAAKGLAGDATGAAAAARDELAVNGASLVFAGPEDAGACDVA